MIRPRAAERSGRERIARVYYLRRQRPRDEYTNELLAYVEREFRTMWQRRNADFRE